MAVTNIINTPSSSFPTLHRSLPAQDPYVVQKPLHQAFVPVLLLLRQICQLEPKLLGADFDLQLVLLLRAVRIPDLSQIDLVTHVPVANTVFVPLEVVLFQWDEIHVVTIPRAFDRDGDPVVEVLCGVVDLEVSDSNFDDAR